MDYEDDIFISYSHLDNESLFDGDPGWISELHRVLDRRVAQLLGAKPKIWRDPDLTGNDVFPETLSKRIRKAAALVCVLSPRYVKSDWCRRELREFTETDWMLDVEGTTKARVFKVVKTQLPVERQPETVRPLLGYEFFKVDPETRRARELDVSIDPGAKKDYMEELDDLAHDIRDLLETAREGSDAVADGDKGTVYLAETSLDLKDSRDAVRRDLRRHGYKVLPDCTLPLSAGELEELVREQVGQASLSVHLVGASFGVVPEGTSESMISIQNEVAAERAAEGGLQRLVWIAPEIEADDERQRAFIEALRDDERTYVNSDLLEVPLEDLKTQVHHRLEAAEAVEATAQNQSVARETPHVYLICDQRDLEDDSLAALNGHLFDCGFEVVLPTFEGDEAQVRQDHVASLTSGDAFLFYYGAGSGGWIRNQMQELEKSRGYPNKRPEMANAIYIAGPPSPQKKLFRTHLTPIVIREGDRFKASYLETFITEIENARALGNG